MLMCRPPAKGVQHFAGALAALLLLLLQAWPSTFDWTATCEA